MIRKPVCAVCKIVVRPRFRPPQAEMAPDLDLRPGEPARSTLAQWVQVCPECGAAAPDLTDLPETACRIVRSDAWASCAGSADTLPFRRWALLLAPRDAADALLQAAWAADDAGEAAEAIQLRMDSAAMWDEVSDLNRACRRVDILRRAGAFDAAAAWIQTIAPNATDEVTSAVLAFQQRRIEARDDGRYLLSAALRPPASAPHVSHGRRQSDTPKRGGLFGRLLGRG